MAAVVVAGGRGERFGGPKQFADLHGQTVAYHSVMTARSVAELVVLVVPPGYGGTGEGADLIVEGGETRSESVRAGLALTEGFDTVVVHDAARPLASADLFQRVVDALVDADAAIPGIPITDTVKRVSDSLPNQVLETISRDDLVTVQTPQAFRRVALMEAHRGAGDGTDDAALLERIGATVVVVPGEVANVKVTEPADLVRAREAVKS